MATTLQADQIFVHKVDLRSLRIYIIFRNFPHLSICQTASFSDVECRTAYCGKHHGKFKPAWHAWTKFGRTAPWGNNVEHMYLLGPSDRVVAKMVRT